MGGEQDLDGLCLAIVTVEIGVDIAIVKTAECVRPLDKSWATTRAFDRFSDIVIPLHNAFTQANCTSDDEGAHSSVRLSRIGRGGWIVDPVCVLGVASAKLRCQRGKREAERRH